MADTISLLNMKGGVGKTTLAVNLAWYMFQKKRKNALLVDLDPQFNATQYVMDFSAFDGHRKNRGTIADLLIDQPRLDLRLKKLKRDPNRALHNVRSETTCRFDLLPAELDLAWVVKNPAQMDYRLEKLLTGIHEGYDFIFIDCAPTDSVLTTMALTASDYFLIPVRPDRFSVLGFANLQKTIETFRKNCTDPHGVKEIGLVFTQVTGTFTVEEQCMTEIRNAAGKEKSYVFNATLKYSRSFARSAKDQTPIFHTLYAQANAKNAAARIADEMLKRIEEISAVR